MLHELIGDFLSIEDKTIKHLSDTFMDNPIRVLKLAYSRAQLGKYYKIAPATKIVIDKDRTKLYNIDNQEVYGIVQNAMSINKSYLFFETLDELQVLDLVFPNIYELKNYREGSVWHTEPNVFEHTMKMLKLASSEVPLIKWMILYHDIAKPLCRKLYGNGAGHDSAELAETLLDIELPPTTKHYVLFHINIHQRIFKIFEGMSPKKIAKLIYTFRKDKRLLSYVLKVSDYDKQGADSLIARTNSDFSKFELAFEEINAYSPYQWIQQQETMPAPSHIQQHIHNHSIQVVRKHL